MILNGFKLINLVQVLSTNDHMQAKRTCLMGKAVNLSDNALLNFIRSPFNQFVELINDEDISVHFIIRIIRIILHMGYPTY